MTFRTGDILLFTWKLPPRNIIDYLTLKTTRSITGEYTHVGMIIVLCDRTYIYETIGENISYSGLPIYCQYTGEKLVDGNSKMYLHPIEDIRMYNGDILHIPYIDTPIPTSHILGVLERNRDEKMAYKESYIYNCILNIEIPETTCSSMIGQCLNHMLDISEFTRCTLPIDIYKFSIKSKKYSNQHNRWKM